MVGLDPTTGHEQRGKRPCVIVSDHRVVAEQRYPMLCVVPLTRSGLDGVLYPTVQPGQSGLREVSYALVDQLRSVDKQRVLGLAGSLTWLELESVDLGLRLYLGLQVVPTSR